MGYGDEDAVINKKLKKYKVEQEHSFYLIEEDIVGWYLIVFDNKHADQSSQDYLFDSLEDALFEAEERFGISKKNGRCL